ncbi:endonuclease G, mitochondrial [Cladophialophora psammophila CBS 110553]|uniref:Endonuclease n=1 Tax=Cladophialophora psammophila CBS 110553 TaxID=1182543 RepID=W9WNK0_9EURO|nr:endonuclease G, mitochondrial [Cladophialophora psammophila CBS 110553]EXJ69448.1 endonuclease G, mitochondrial [Cladophialophora psammophila CBS 110553]
MSKTTIAIIAATSAFAGASLTALLFPSHRKDEPKSTPTLKEEPSTVPALSIPPAPIPVPVPVPVAAPAPHPSAAVLPPVDPSGILRYGFPGPIADTLATPSHLSSFNRFTRNPHWVAEHFTAQSLLLNNGSRRNSVFYEDLSIPSMFRAKLSDYFRSGYDRGHQVPAADAKWSQEAMDSTFVLSNMCPQVGEGFNRDYWAHFEEFCRDLVKRFPSVRVVTGPLYLPKKDERDGKWRVSYEVIGNPPNVAVPTHFYKIIFAEEAAQSPSGTVALGAFVLPNAEIPNSKSLSDFEVPLEAVERASGLVFADKLPPERRKRLCREVRCEIMVREFDKSRQQANNIGQVSRGSPQMQQPGGKW